MLHVRRISFWEKGSSQEAGESVTEKGVGGNSHRFPINPGPLRTSERFYDDLDVAAHAVRDDRARSGVFEQKTASLRYFHLEGVGKTGIDGRRRIR